MTTIYYPNKREAQIEIDVTGTSEDYSIEEIRFLMGDNSGDIVITGSLEGNERIRKHIEDELVVEEYENREKENYYFDLGKELMMAQAEGY